MALEDIFSAVAADAGGGGHGGRAARALQGLGGCLQVVVEVGVLDHQVTRDDGQWELHLDLGLTSGQYHLLGLVPHARSGWRRKTCFFIGLSRIFI